MLLHIYHLLMCRSIRWYRNQLRKRERRFLQPKVKPNCNSDHSPFPHFPIPIHHRILPLITKRMKFLGSNLIADSEGKPYDYSRYCILWREVMHSIKADGHTTHDCRHTVATLLDNAEANETAKRRILGHAGGDVTERVYTHKGLRQLRKCIELLK